MEYPAQSGQDAEADQGRQFIAWFVRRGRVHFSADDCRDEVLQKAAQMIRSDREGTRYGSIRPGLAEYLDILSVVTALYPGDPKAQHAGASSPCPIMPKKARK